MKPWPNYDFPAGAELEENSRSRREKLLDFLDDSQPTFGYWWEALLDGIQMMAGSFVGALLAISFSNLSGADQATPTELFPVILWIFLLYVLLTYLMPITSDIVGVIWEAVYAHWRNEDSSR